MVYLMLFPKDFLVIIQLFNSLKIKFRGNGLVKIFKKITNHFQTTNHSGNILIEIAGKGFILIRDREWFFKVGLLLF